MKNTRIRASEEKITKLLQGNWREEHLFALKQAMVLYDNYGTLLTECDAKLESMLATLVGDDDSKPGRGRRASNSKNAPQFDVRTYLFRLCGFDLTRINGINPTSAQGDCRSRFRYDPLQKREAFCLLAGIVSWHKDFRRVTTHPILYEPPQLTLFE